MDNSLSRKVFISYSWSSAQHELWVLKLCESLQENGVEVRLDKWYLREGADKYKFMEESVTDPSIHKVLIISDALYAKKADGREGGVGTETQIISPEVYGKADQNRFVPVVTEKNADDTPCLPQYLKNRIYIDMTDAADYEDTFDQLLRWIFDKPLHKPPPLGKPPSYIVKADTPSLGTEGRLRRAKKALEEGKQIAQGAVIDYFETLVRNMSKLQIVPEQGSVPEPFDEAVVASIGAFKPYRDQVVDLLEALCRYAPEMPLDSVQRFLESVLSYCFRPKDQNSWRRDYNDNYRFMAQEMFLYTIAVLLRYERFEAINELLSASFCLPESPDVRDRVQPFHVFRRALRSFETRNDRLKLGRLNLVADYFQERASHHLVPFSRLMEADFLLFLRSDLTISKEPQRWWPDTLIYSTHWPQPFEIFLRARSKRYFDRMRVAIGAESVDHLRNLMTKYKSEPGPRVPSWQFDSIDPEALADLENLATRP